MNENFDEISTNELRDSLGKQGITVVDTRQVDAYNGWRLRGEFRGGHIVGARSIFSKWTEEVWWPELLKSKQIDKKDAIIVYGYDSLDSLKVAKALNKAGYDNIILYSHFIDEWTTDTGLPMEFLSRFRHLVPPQWLKSILDGEQPDEYDGHRFVICHSHFRNPDDYEMGHIPGAIALDTLALEEPKMWNRRTPEEIEAALEQHGITHDTTVIIYGRFSNPNNDDPFPGSNAGHIGAFRNALIMLYAGVKDVRILNGGLMSWEALGYETTTESTKPVAVDDFGVKIPANPRVFIDTPEAKELLASPNGDLVSIRSWDEFIGLVSGYNYIDIKGRIPGAIFGNCGSDAYHMENFRNPDHTTREYDEIERNWLESNVIPDKRIAFYCGTGWRASEAFFNAWFLGWPNVAVYDGGWMEWSSDPKNPIETGNKS